MKKQTAARLGRLDEREYSRLLEKKFPNLKRLSEEEYEKMKCEKIKVCHCPLGGDESNDCADCAYSCDYHFVNGECVERGYEKDVCDRGGDTRLDCKYCAAGILNHCVNGKCVRR